MRHFALFLLGAVFVSGGRLPRRRPETVHVYAAASTEDVVEEIARAFKDETGIAVDVTPAASSILAKQIEKGADADLFLSADEDWADYLGRPQVRREAPRPPRQSPGRS